MTAGLPCGARRAPCLLICHQWGVTVAVHKSIYLLPHSLYVILRLSSSTVSYDRILLSVDSRNGVFSTPFGQLTTHTSSKADRHQPIIKHQCMNAN
jgi:hypothetical protein